MLGEKDRDSQMAVVHCSSNKHESYECQNLSSIRRISIIEITTFNHLWCELAPESFDLLVRIGYDYIQYF